MRFPFRRKDKKKHDASGTPERFRPAGATQLPSPPPSYASAQLLSALPTNVLERIFAHVCPHSQDDSYETCEESAKDNGCMLCDMRDLAHCAQVSRAWRASAINVLYHSVRIDQVHYCKLEAWLAEKRKQSRFDRNAIPEDPAQARLRLFRRTVRDDPTRIGHRVQFLKLPYMLRESCHVELAQTIAVLPNLRYVDLPEGMYCDEPKFATLRLEVQARCPNLRKMTYNEGSERSLAMLATGKVWRRLEVLELNGVNIDTFTMRAVLGSFARLRALKVSRTESLSDEVLTSADGPAMPPLEELVLEATPRLTAAGLVEYLAWQETQQSLKVLTLKDSGVKPQGLQDVLTMAPWLKILALQTKVSEPFPNNAGIGPLESQSLETLRYEISASSEREPYVSMKSGYYSYLASSILSGSLPKLRRVYVQDDTFPEQLQGLPPPMAGFADGHTRPSLNSSTMTPPASARLPPPGYGAAMLSPSPAPRRPVSAVPSSQRFSSNNPFAAHVRAQPAPTHTLEVYTKRDELGKWNFSRVDAITAAVAAPLRRPVSSYGLGADVAGQGWDRGEARRSVMISDASGQFLPLPGQQGIGGQAASALSESWRPHSSGGESSRRKDMWR